MKSLRLSFLTGCLWQSTMFCIQFSKNFETALTFSLGVLIKFILLHYVYLTETKALCMYLGVGIWNSSWVTWFQPALCNIEVGIVQQVSN